MLDKHKRLRKMLEQSGYYVIRGKGYRRETEISGGNVEHNRKKEVEETRMRDKPGFCSEAVCINVRIEVTL